MNWNRTTTAGRTVYFAVAAGVTFSIYRAGTSAWRLSIDGEEQEAKFRLLNEAKAEAERALNTILDELAAAARARIAEAGIKPGVIVTVKGRTAGPVMVKHVALNGTVELSRPDGGTFRREAADLTVVSPEELAAYDAAIVAPPVVGAAEAAQRARVEQTRQARALEAMKEASLLHPIGSKILTDGVEGPAEVVAKTEHDLIVKGRDGHRVVVDPRQALLHTPAPEAPIESLRAALSIHRGDEVEVEGRTGTWTVVRITSSATLILANENRVIEVPGSDVTAVVLSDHLPVGDEGIVEAEETVLYDPATDPRELADVAAREAELVEYDPADGEGTLTTEEPEGWAAKRAELAREIIDGRTAAPVRDELANYRAAKEAEAAEAPAPALHSPEEISDAARDARGWARLSAALDASRRGPAIHAVAILAPGDRVVDKGLNVWDVVEVSTDETGEGIVVTKHAEGGYTRRFLFPSLIAAVEAGEIRVYHTAEPEPEVLTPGRVLELVNDALEYHAREWSYPLTTRGIKVSGEDSDAEPALEVRFPGGAYVLHAEILR
ncbi:hypothetical protein SEA_BUMBLE_47 [Arthrobacter phage Bumble]|uniref:Uncharacterized protein n=1 Tax=Arthrobacter phage Bumble TaxID=2743904 RepID=A0A7G3VC88_9CAUD|nr:hypothetical protein SEA_BUMBLE_47 [Arthrobacter phage Bumble]